MTDRQTMSDPLEKGKSATCPVTPNSALVQLVRLMARIQAEKTFTSNDENSQTNKLEDENI